MKLAKRIAHGFRWALETAFIWGLVLPETGLWTCVFATIITIQSEWDHANPLDWSKL